MDLAQRKEWNENHKRLTGMIMMPSEHYGAVDLFLNHHAWLFSSKMANFPATTLEDELLRDLKEEAFRKYPVETSDTKNSIVWHLWHITRIEDMTMNVLVDGKDQIFHKDRWKGKLNVKLNHCGNDMETEEIADLSTSMDLDALCAYRLAVGRRTCDIIKSLEPGQFKQKVEPDRCWKLVEQEAVTDKSNWLIQYWGGKTIAGLVLMPATRHHFVHLNRCLRIKKKYQSDLGRRIHNWKI